ncbi:MAG: methyltransferase domain-containing protein [Acidobacteria bacterium]|nr:methyltransferase domain-containing protein [Acidobacteriota bacterium]
MTTATRPPNPSLFWEHVTAYQRSAAIRAAIDLDVFTAIGEGADTPSAMAPRCQASERGLRILADHLTVSGFLTKADGRYALTADSAMFLDRRSPAYLGAMTGFLLHEGQRKNFWELTDTIRRGTIPAERPDALGAEHPMWIDFAKSMAGMMAPMAEFLTGLTAPQSDAPYRVLDIAAGHGLFGIAFARKYPQVDVTALDWPAVLAVAHQNAVKAGVAEQHHLLPGSAFATEFGGPYDLILLTNILHHFDPAGCVTLIQKVREALAPGGQALTLEFIPNPDRVSPPEAASFSLTMLANTPAGDAYTYAEYDEMFQQAGFGSPELIEPPFGPQRVLRSQK